MENKITNELLARIKEPLHEVFPVNLTLLLDAKGNILDRSKEFRPFIGGYLAKLSALLDKENNVREVFELPEKEDLAACADQDLSFFQKGSSFSVEEGLEIFYSSQSFCFLKLYALSTDRLAGMVLLTTFLPNIFERSSGGMLFIDKAERIVGFNQSFFDLFKSRTGSPAEILGQPVSSFLDPLPSTFQKNYLREITLPAPGTVRRQMNRDYTTRQDRKAELLSDDRDFEWMARGVQWNARHTEGSFITFPDSVDFTAYDLNVRFACGGALKALPCIVLGDLIERGPAPRDSDGYLIGPNYEGTKIILKRAGFTVASEPLPSIPGEEYTVEFYKIKDAFLLFINGQKVFAYYDHESLDRKSVHISLFLRHSNACLLKSAGVSITEPGVPPERPKLFVRLKNGRENYYLLNALHSFYLSNREAEYQGYRLQDITEFQFRVRALEEEYLKKLEEQKRLSRLLEKYQRDQDEWVGSGKRSALIKERALRIAGSTATVLLQGPTGSGKEVLAQFIHRHSAYAKGPFVKVDCSTLPKSLMESILFGHEKGAFTGAYKRNIGMLEQAQGGTLFLDEVNNLSSEAQTKLLQFLQDYRIVRVGGEHPIKLNVRILVASNMNLKEMVDRKNFREDLYYRMAVVTIDLPPLTERLEELPELTGYFLDHFNRVNNKRIKGFTAAAHKKLYAYPWPGNVRELKNVIERAVLFCSGDEIAEEQLLLSEPGRMPAPGANAKGRKEYQPLQIEKEELLKAAERHRGVMKKIAEELNVSRRSLYYHLERMGIAPNAFRKIPRRAKRN